MDDTEIRRIASEQAIRLTEMQIHGWDRVSDDAKRLVYEQNFQSVYNNLRKRS